MKFVCGSCNELIQDIHTSRYQGGAIPHEACGSVTTFEPTDHPHTPKAVDVRPYFPKEQAPHPRLEEAIAYIMASPTGYSREAALEIIEREGGVDKILAFKAKDERERIDALPLLSQSEPPSSFVCKFCETGDVLVFDRNDFVHKVDCQSGEGLDDFARAVRHAISTGLTATEAIEIVHAEGAEFVLRDAEKTNAAQNNAGEGNAVVSQPDTSEAAPASEGKLPHPDAKQKSSKKSQGK